MVQIKMFAICLACFFVLSFVNCAENELRFDVANVEFTTVPNITQFLRTNPKIKLIQTLAQVKNPQVKDQMTYRLGNRVSGMLGFSHKKKFGLTKSIILVILR